MDKIGKPPAVHGSDAAPVIYFDGIIAWGINNGVIQFELGTNQIVPVDLVKGPNKVRVVVAAHLRFSFAAANQLSELLDEALGMTSTENKIAING